MAVIAFANPRGLPSFNFIITINNQRGLNRAHKAFEQKQQNDQDNN